MDTQDSKLGFSPEEAATASGAGRTKIFQAIKDGKLSARKFGRRTIILADDLKAFLAALPEREVSRAA
ncbi:excisionase family DNA-binding protein [Bradyrhizobium cenepequi]|uniref:excisionase family DNA-binding protein n=1 Tax=Bradyrhizobium cenepequi TaxID=2821403 RepID=UPI001CE29ADE|nr:excisionase family DNA-binding protein [Bradyrhizobium cenepequi]MCA6108563.1 excisionase family DNA-binding protein [Bradyrhizobium cenepequi]